MNTCGGCDSTWSGSGMAHCASCHETFSTVRNFYSHRPSGQCVKPQRRGLVKDLRGVWMAPPREETG